MSTITEMTWQQRSLLFANLAKIAYYNLDIAKSKVKKLGFTTTKFYDKDGIQAYRFSNKADVVIACRGTEPSQWSDIKADAEAWPVISETISRVHKGFKDAVDDLWQQVQSDISKNADKNKTLWFW